MAPNVNDISRFLESWAPPGAALSYDNVGLQVGDKNKTVSNALIALELTPEVLDEALTLNVDLIVTHHPLIFRPLKKLTPDTYTGRLVLRLVESGIALYSLHTNLDVAPGGVSFALATHLGLSNVRPLEKLRESLVKLVTFVPEVQFHSVREALAEAGAGRIGDYEACAFSSKGTGYFRPGDSANPFVGSAGGNLESVTEIRIETEVTSWHLNAVIQALKEAHPYEEVPYDVYPVSQSHTLFGMGAIGRLHPPVPLSDFLQLLSSRLRHSGLRYTGNPEQNIQHVAVCGGSGSDLIPAALREKADVFITGDISYHKFFDVLNADGSPDMVLIDAGHYETEQFAESLIQSRLQAQFTGVRWIKTDIRTSPSSLFVSRK